MLFSGFFSLQTRRPPNGRSENQALIFFVSSAPVDGESNSFAIMGKKFVFP
jgi:hypothetical protein